MNLVNTDVVLVLLMIPGLLCLPCSPGCASDGCTGSVCEKCKKGYILDNGLCFFICPPTCDGCTPDIGCDFCKSGYYGVLCERQCNVNCKNGVCDKMTGTCEMEENPDENTGNDECPDPCGKGCWENCLTCNAQKTHCMMCKQGLWGLACEKSCPDYCLDNKCDRYAGWCTSVKPNTTTESVVSTTKTHTPCPKGYFGERCDGICPENCLDFLCMDEDGSCAYGCAEGYFGDRCNQPCLTKCNNECDRETGRCLDSCKDGADCTEEETPQANTGDAAEDDGTTNIIIGGVVASFGVAIATVVVVVILVMRMRVRRRRAREV